VQFPSTHRPRPIFELGIGNEVVGHEQLLPTALAWCARIERLPPHVLAMTEPLLRQCADMTWEQAIAVEEFAEPMLLHDAGAHGRPDRAPRALSAVVR
jgi:2-(1,2-epoxy-1,2-dihydrophenyl)acetyl-CoA isomerase